MFSWIKSAKIRRGVILQLDVPTLIENNLVTLIALFIFYMLSRKRKVKKMEMGPLKVENETDADKFEVINPQDNCPYDKAYTATRNEIRRVQKLVHEEIQSISADVKALNVKTDQLIGKINNMDIKMEELDTNQLKIIFRSTGQPQEDRLLAGVKYVHKGENGDLKQATIDMSLKWLDMYNAICAVKPEYRIPEVEKQQDLRMRK